MCFLGLARCKGLGLTPLPSSADWITKVAGFCTSMTGLSHELVRCGQELLLCIVAFVTCAIRLGRKPGLKDDSL
jgi:hypothetical protein